jgi:hypothetical protein
LANPALRKTSNAFPKGVVALAETKFPLARGKLPPGEHGFPIRGRISPPADPDCPRRDPICPRGGETVPQKLLIALSGHQNALAETKFASSEGLFSLRKLLLHSWLHGLAERTPRVACREIVVDRLGVRASAGKGRPSRALPSSLGVRLSLLIGCALGESALPHTASAMVRTSLNGRSANRPKASCFVRRARRLAGLVMPQRNLASWRGVPRAAWFCATS